MLFYTLHLSALGRWCHWDLSSFFFCFFAETQDDLEAITNDIKKMANNARNKLKSESDTRAQPRIKWRFGAFSAESEYSKMI